FDARLRVASRFSATRKPLARCRASGTYQNGSSLQEGDYSFFATRGDRRELHRAALVVEDSISCIPLRKDDLIVSVVPNSHPSTEFFAQSCGTETESTFTRHRYLLAQSIQV